jgi:hypothetical protein
MCARDSPPWTSPLRRAGAEMGIPTMMGKESAGASRVKVTITTAQSEGSP